MSGRVSFVSEVDGHKADADAGHCYKDKYQIHFQGAQAPGTSTSLLYIHLPRSAEDGASSNNSPPCYPHMEVHI